MAEPERARIKEWDVLEPRLTEWVEEILKRMREGGKVNGLFGVELQALQIKLLLDVSKRLEKLEKMIT